jgi:hypothetical protein
MPILPPTGAPSGFTLGPPQNVFVGADRAAAETARDNYDTANPGWITAYDNDISLNIRLEYSDGPDQVALFQVRDSGGTVWLDNSSATGVQGETGPAGATGNSYFFASKAARDAFFGASPNEGLLESGLPVVVNVGNDIESTFIWGGETAPASYDATLWRLSSKEVSSGSILLGQDGAKISSASQVLGFTGAGGNTALIPIQSYNDTGSSIPRVVDLGSRITLPLTNVFDTQLPAPQTYTVATTNDELFVGYSFRPAEAGNLRVEIFLGTDDTAPQIADTYHTITAGQIGTEVSIDIGNDVLISNNQDIFVKASGIDLFGGLQTAGPLAGQTVIYNTADVQLATFENVALSSDLDSKADKADVLELDNTTPFTPDADYEPATKKYVDDALPVFGTEFQAESDGTVRSTTSTSFQQAQRLTTPSLPSGTYRIGVMTLHNLDRGTRDILIRAQVNDTTILFNGEDYRKRARDGGSEQRESFQGFDYFTGSGVLNIDIDYAPETGGTQATMYFTNIEIWRVA